MNSLEKELQARNVQRVELVAAYVRVSTQEQKLHGLSLDAQKMKLTEYAEKNNMKIVEWYIDEGVSGRKPIAKSSNKRLKLYPITMMCQCKMLLPKQ